MHCDNDLKENVFKGLFHFEENSNRDNWILVMASFRNMTLLQTKSLLGKHTIKKSEHGSYETTRWM